MKKQIHIPRGSGKSYVQRIQEERDKDLDVIGKFRTFHVYHDEVASHTMDNYLIFTNNNHSAYRTKVNNLYNCDFSDVKNDFKVNYGCKHCRHHQTITSTDLMFNQFIRKPIHMFADIRIICGSCGKACTVPLRAFIKKLIMGYTGQLQSELNHSLPNLVDKLHQILKFDCMLSGKTSYIVESDSLTDLIYD